jgi:integrase
MKPSKDYKQKPAKAKLRTETTEKGCHKWSLNCFPQMQEVSGIQHQQKQTKPSSRKESQNSSYHKDMTSHNHPYQHIGENLSRDQWTHKSKEIYSDSRSSSPLDGVSTSTSPNVEPTQGRPKKKGKPTQESSTIAYPSYIYSSRSEWQNYQPLDDKQSSKSDFRAEQDTPQPLLSQENGEASSLRNTMKKLTSKKRNNEKGDLEKEIDLEADNDMTTREETPRTDSEEDQDQETPEDLTPHPDLGRTRENSTSQDRTENEQDPSRSKVKFLLEGVGGHRSRRLDGRDDTKGTKIGIQQKEGGPSYKQPKRVTFVGDGSSGNATGNERNAFEEGNKGAKGKDHPWTLFTSFPSTKEGRHDKTSIKSKTTKPFFEKETFQDGDNQRRHSDAETRLLDGKIGSEGRLLSHTNQETGPEVSTIQARWEALRIQMSVLRDVLSPESVLEGDESASEVVATARDIVCSIFGRFFGDREVTGTSNRTLTIHDTIASEIGFHHQRREIGADTQSGDHFFGLSLKFLDDDDSSTKREGKTSETKYQENSEQEVLLSKTNGIDSGTDLVSNPSNLHSQVTHKRTSTLENGTYADMGYHKVFDTFSDRRADLVASRDSELERSIGNTSSNSVDITDGRIGLRVGSSTEGSQREDDIEDTRFLDTSGKETLHQCQRIIGSNQGIEEVRTMDTETRSVSDDGQHNHTQLHQPSGGQEMAIRNVNEIFRGVDGPTTDKITSNLHSGSSEHGGGRIVQKDAKVSGLDDKGLGLQQDSSKMEDERGSVCLGREQQTTKVLLLVSGNSLEGDRRFEPELEREVGLGVPTSETYRQNIAEDTGRESTGGTPLPLVGKSVLVPNTMEVSFSETVASTQELVEIRRSSTGGDGKQMADDRMETRRQTLTALNPGLSDAALSMLSGNNKESTSKTYSSGWNVFVKWCEKQDPIVTPSLASIESIINFFAEKSKEVTVGTLKTYRSALSDTCPLIKDKRIGEHDLVIRFFRNLKHKEAAAKYDHFWELAKVLLIYKTRTGLSLLHKTLFLIRVSTLCRMSELCNLRRRDVAWSEESAVITFTGGKTRKSNEQWRKTIPKLEEDKKEFCPYRTLQEWWTWSGKEYKLSGDDTLWYSTKAKKNNTLAKDTSNRYVANEMHETLGIPIEFSPHSIRGAVATHLLNEGVASRQVMHLGDWRSESVMEEHYLRSEKKKADPKHIFKSKHSFM